MTATPPGPAGRVTFSFSFSFAFGVTICLEEAKAEATAFEGWFFSAAADAAADAAGGAEARRDLATRVGVADK